MVGIMADIGPLGQEDTMDLNDENIEEDGEFDDCDEKQFDDPPGFVDTVSDEELVGDILKEAPKESDGLDTVIIIDNVPVVGPERIEKLKTVIRKVFSGLGKIVSEYYPLENGSTKGYIFLEFSNAMDAAHAAKTADGYKLDKNHIFAVNAFSDFYKFDGVPENWTPPEKKPYEDKGNLKSWLLDPDGNDQYAIIHASGEQVAVLANTASGPLVARERSNWTETYVRWSQQGTYLATFHQRGIALWGGSDFVRIQRFSHPGVQLIDFSPCERYLVTYRPEPDNPEDPQAIIMWDLRTGQNKRAFTAADASQWPVFKWSHDGSYFARVGGNALSVYETPSFGMLDRKSIKINNIREFSWSPGANLVAYWTPEDKDTPARVAIMQIPGRKEVRVKNLFNVADCKMYWQKKGDFLAVKVERYTKSKKAVYYNLELFKMREKEIPVDTLEIKDPIIAVEWEPNGSKFVVIHGENPRISASFYELEEKSMGKVTLLKRYEKRQVNSIFWAPTGQFVVLAGLRNMNGVLEFYDTADMTCMNTAEHFMATDVEWDPTGRYLATSVSWWAHKVDNGYYIWSFQGRLLQRHQMENFCQFSWRPRPPSLLKEEDLKRIRKDLKRYQKMFEMKDQMSQTKASKELIEKRGRLYSEFKELRAVQRTHFFELRERRLELRGGVDTDTLESNLDDIEEEVVEFFIKEEVENLEGEE